MVFVALVVFQEEVMVTPGAYRSAQEPKLENDALTSVMSVAADRDGGDVAGLRRAGVGLELPAATA